MTTKQEQFAKWAITRKKGMLRFVLLYGVLGWGLITAVLYSILMWLFSDIGLHRILPLSLLIFPVGGVLWGCIMWWLSERGYRAHASSHDP